jgi:hypothetical protein
MGCRPGRLVVSTSAALGRLFETGRQTILSSMNIWRALEKA